MTASPETVPDRTTIPDRTIPAASPTVTRRTPLPEIEPEPSGPLDRFLVALFVAIPLLAVLAAIPLAWNLGWLGWHDVVIALVFYVISGMGISMGFHRYFTHSSFKANRGLKNALAIAGSLAIEGPVLVWVADHRRHHKQRQRRRPALAVAVRDGLEGAHQGLRLRARRWTSTPTRPSQAKFCPDLLADKDVSRVPAVPAWSPCRCSPPP